MVTEWAHTCEVRAEVWLTLSPSGVSAGVDASGVILKACDLDYLTIHPSKALVACYCTGLAVDLPFAGTTMELVLPPPLSLGTAGLPRSQDPTTISPFPQLIIQSLSPPSSLQSIDGAYESTHWYNPTELALGITSSCNNSPADYLGCVDSLYITTKIPPWELGNSVRARDIAREELERYYIGWWDEDANESFSKSCTVKDDHTCDNLRKKKQPALGCLLIHAPMCWEGWHPKCSENEFSSNWRETWKGMEAALHLDHTVRCIGISNFRATEVKEMQEWISGRQSRNKSSKMNLDPFATFPMVYQGSANPYFPPSQTLLSLINDMGARFQAYSIMGKGVYISGKEEVEALAAASQFGGLERLISTPVLKNPVIRAIAQSYKWSTARVILEWGRAKGWLVISRTSDAEHIKQLGELRERWTVEPEVGMKVEDVAKIDELAEWRG